MKTLIYKKWITSDEWSGVEDDGYSLHLSESDLNTFIDQHWKKYPSNTPPPFYVAPDLLSPAKHVEVSDELYERVAASNGGLRFYDEETFA